MYPPETGLAGVFDALDNGLIVVAADGRVEVWNSWLAEASGISTEGALGQMLEEIFPDGLPSRLSRAIHDALVAGASSLLTHTLHPRILPLRSRAGKVLIHNVSVRPLGEKPYSRCVVQINDVTVATERERVLRERQNAKYAAVVDHAPDAILTADADGLVQFANPAAQQAFGYAPSELAGQPVSFLFQDAAIWTPLWDAVLGGEVMPRPAELIARRKDGSVTYLEVSAARWVADSRTFVTAILRDVNERHAAEAALRRLNETLEERVATTLAERQLLADIVETTDAFIQVLDLDYRFLAVNKASADEFERVFGMRPGIGANLLELLADTPQERDNAKALWSRALAGEDFSVVQEFGDPGLDRRYYELKFNVLRDASGQQIAAYQFVYDVTERLQHEARLAEAEEALRQSQKMEAIGQLTGGIAHDFNNLLTGIMGAMDILQRRIAAGRYEDTQRFMDAAMTSANRAAALTHRLLAFARRQPLDPRPTDPNHLIRGMDDLLRRTLGERMQLSVDLAPDAWPIRTDPNQLENAVLNLVINARDAMPDGGRLTITTRNETISQSRREGLDEIAAGDYAVVCVADTGVGIAPEILAKVFEPFFTTKPLGQGTGLGLSMIYGFARQTRGHVRIDSTPGAGTQVSLFLPRYTGDMASERGGAASERPVGAGEAVLLVEDDPAVRLLIGEVLRDLGYACIEAIDGQAALPMLLSNARLDLMITDVGLPGMNGRQLAEIARQHRPELKILFVTGYAEHATGAERFLEPGMAMVTKPFMLDALAQKIREILAASS